MSDLVDHFHCDSCHHAFPFVVTDDEGNEQPYVMMQASYFRPLPATAGLTLAPQQTLLCKSCGERAAARAKLDASKPTIVGPSGKRIN